MRAIVILSGGLDSTVNLAWACREHVVVRAVTFDYGQRAARREVERSGALCTRYGVPHEVVAIPFLAAWTRTALVNRHAALPQPDPDRLDAKQEAEASAMRVWVPNRNGVFLNVAAALAESLGAEILVVGFNQEEGGTFPDNSADFVDAINVSFSYSTLNHVKVVCRTLSMHKGEIVKLGLALGVPFELVWSCYEGGEKMCGVCESCLRLKRGVGAESPELLEALSFAG